MTGFSAIDKAQLRQDLCAALADALETVTAAQRASQAGATHEESRAENDKDMRATEVSYLARGQAERVVTLRAEIAKVESFTLRAFSEGEAVSLSALLLLEDDEGRHVTYFMAPGGGGVRVQQCGVTVVVVTPESPLGRGLVGLHQGDDVEVKSPQGTRELTLIGLR